MTKKWNLQSFLLILYGIAMGAGVTGLIWLTATPPRGTLVALLPTRTPGLITVYVSGAVVMPGIYSLPEGSRVHDAVQAAGGFAEGAESAEINLAKLLEDGEQIDVPGILIANRLSYGRININTASAAELESLPGIGPSAAQAIVDYRNEHGLFISVQDILLVPGIGPATYDQIKDYLTVGDR